MVIMGAEAFANNVSFFCRLCLFYPVLFVIFVFTDVDFTLHGQWCNI